MNEEHPVLFLKQQPSIVVRRLRSVLSLPSTLYTYTNSYVQACEPMSNPADGKIEALMAKLHSAIMPQPPSYGMARAKAAPKAPDSNAINAADLSRVVQWAGQELSIRDSKVVTNACLWLPMKHSFCFLSYCWKSLHLMVTLLISAMCFRVKPS